MVQPQWFLGTTAKLRARVCVCICLYACVCVCVCLYACVYLYVNTRTRRQTYHRVRDLIGEKSELRQKFVLQGPGLVVDNVSGVKVSLTRARTSGDITSVRVCAVMRYLLLYVLYPIVMSPKPFRFVRVGPRKTSRGLRKRFVFYSFTRRVLSYSIGSTAI